MFGFKRRKKPAAGFRTLPEVRDLLKVLVGNAMDVYVGTVVGHLLNLGGRTAEDVERAKARALACLQRYVRSEILLDAQDHGRGPEIAELAGLRPE